MYFGFVILGKLGVIGVSQTECVMGLLRGDKTDLPDLKLQYTFA